MTDPSASRITLATLEKVIARLKLTDFFSFGQGELNQPHGHWDVFPDVERLDDFDPTDEGDANEFLMWTGAAGEAAFDDDGVLRHPLPIVWGGSFADLQTAFAEAGLAVRIELDEEPREPYGQSGRLVLSPRSASVDCDLLVMLRAFAELEREGIVALANAGYTQSDGWTDVAERAGDDEPTAVFWHAQKHAAFDGLGNLASPLLLHWRGDADAIIAGLRRAGFAVAAAPPEHTCIEVTSGPTTAAQLESFEDASARGRGAASEAVPGRVVVGPGGPLELVHTFRGRDRQPVVRFAFDPRVPARLAFAQAMDTRGFPTSPAYVVDLARHAVERALLPDQRAMGVGGMRFLRDGRLVLCTTQLRSEGAGAHGASCLVLHVWASELPSEEEVLVQAFSHIDDTALLSFDDAERWAAVGQPEGVDVYAIPARGEQWQAPARLRVPDEPVRAYTRTAVSPDGAYVVWCDDWSAPLACFERASGTLRWRHPPRAQARSQLRCSPDSSIVALQVGRRDEETRRIELFRIDTGAPIHGALTEATRRSRCFAFHPAGGCLAVGRDDGRTSLYTIPDGALIADVNVLAKGGVSALEFDAEGTHLAVGGSKGDVALFQVLLERLVASTSSSAAPAPRSEVASLARKGAHPWIGATGRITDGAWSGHAATVQLVGSGGEKLRVEIQLLGRKMTVDVDARSFRPAGAGEHVSDACPYRVGDLVFVHDGYFERGRELEVCDVDEAGRRIFVKPPPDDDDDGEGDEDDAAEDDEWTPIDFDDVTLVRPLRRDPLPDYLAALARVRTSFGHFQALGAWCARQLKAVDWDVDHPSLDADGELAAEFVALERSVREACRKAHEERTQRFRDQFEPLTPEQRVERWKTDWASWVDWRPHVRSLPPELEELGMPSDDGSRDKHAALMKLRERFEKDGVT